MPERRTRRSGAGRYEQAVEDYDRVSCLDHESAAALADG